jgi:FkbM family methyltransferase
MRPKEAFRLRPGTWDEIVYDQVYAGNEYGLPARMGDHDVVLDIGAHIGCFSLAAIDRGAGTVLAAEPDPDNFKLLSENCADPIRNGKIIAVEAAVVRSDGRAGGTVLYDGYRVDGGIVNTAAGRTTEGKGVPVPAVPFDELVDRALEASREKDIKLLKLDCEGVEWEILYTTKRLDRIVEIVGEYHNWGAPSGQGIADLLAFLKAGGFAKVEHSPSDPYPQGHFRARRQVS